MDDRLIPADTYDAFDRARNKYPRLFPSGVVTPDSILKELQERGQITTRNDIYLSKGDVYRLTRAARG